MKSVLIFLASAALVSATFANTAPTPVIQSAAMRPGTTFMDIVYRVNDPDDATVKVRALAFVDGVRSFANVLRPVTFVEGTASKIGDAIASNTDHTLTWDVGADWNIDLGQVKFEILCRDARGLLPFDWITIPAAGGNAALTISKDAPSSASVLSALFWQYADGDSWLSLTNGILTGNAGSGVFAGVALVSGGVLQSYGTPYIFKRMNLDPADSTDIAHALTIARAGLSSTSSWHAVNRPYTGVSMIVTWGLNDYGQSSLPTDVGSAVIALAAGSDYSLALMSDGTVRGWGRNLQGQITIPAGLNRVTAIDASNGSHNLALMSDGTVVGWGYNGLGQTTIPAGLNRVTAIAAGGNHSLALKSDGTVIGWGHNSYGQTTIPAGLSGVTAIKAGSYHSLALKSDGTVVGWGLNNNGGQATPPAGLNGVIAIAAGGDCSLALKSDGTVVGWGAPTMPAGWSSVTAIAAGSNGANRLALKSDGTVVGSGATAATIPAGLSGVTAIAAGSNHSLALKAKAP